MDWIQPTRNNPGTTIEAPGLFSLDRPFPRAYNHFYGCQIKMPVSRCFTGCSQGGQPASSFDQGEAREALP